MATEISDADLVTMKSRDYESLLRKKHKAYGKGMFMLVQSIEEKIPILAALGLYHFAKIRNQFIHVREFPFKFDGRTIDRTYFIELCDLIDRELDMELSQEIKQIVDLKEEYQRIEKENELLIADKQELQKVWESFQAENHDLKEKWNQVHLENVRLSEKWRDRIGKSQELCQIVNSNHREAHNSLVFSQKSLSDNRLLVSELKSLIKQVEYDLEHKIFPDQWAVDKEREKIIKWFEEMKKLYQMITFEEHNIKRTENDIKKLADTLICIKKYMEI